MNRRTFTQSLATAALAVAAPRIPAASPGAGSSPADSSHAAGPLPLSIMLWTVWGSLPFEQRLEKVVEAGYTNVELVGEYKSWTADDLARANAARKRLGVHFDATAGLPGVADPANRDALLAAFNDALKTMETLEITAMIFVSGNVIPSLPREAQHQSCVDGLKRAAAMVEGRQIAGKPVMLLLECIDPEENPKIFLSSATEAIDIVREVNHPQVRFLYDMFHEQIGHGNLIEKLEKNIDVIALIHVADVPGRHEPGTGEINYTNIFRKLGELKYQGMVAMEFRPTGDPVAMLRAAKELAWSAARS
jgi:hydroxypyruvate isomerase